MFQNNLLMAAASISAAGGITVDNSVRYNDNDSPYLYQTPSSAGNRKTGSISLWYKRCNLGSIMQLFNAGAGDDITFNASDKLTFIDSSGVSYITTQVFHDPTAWGHLLFAWDTTLAAAGDRLRIYHNGVEITAFDTETNPSLNDEFEISNTVRQTIGANESNTEEFDGYLAQVYLVDGTQLTPISFGGFDSNNVWRPIEYLGSYGTTGYLLDFVDSSALGNDVSGNDNDFASSGLAADDQMTDTPTNNWCTFNSASLQGGGALSNGNLSLDPTGSTTSARGSIGLSSGKWYWEFTMRNGNTNERSCYIVQSTATSGTGQIHSGAGTWDSYYSYNGNAYDSVSGSVAYGNSYTAGDVIGCALDLDNKAIWWSKNGTWQNSATEGEIEAGTTTNAANTGLADGVWTPCYQGNASSQDCDANFGQASYSGTQPEGFLDINTANLATPTILDGTAYFQPTLYTGDGSVRNIDQTGNSTFQPDMVWIKNRSQADNHMLIDAARGVTKQMHSDSTAVETIDANGLKSFDSNGFGLGSGANGYNDNTETFVAWQWKAGTGAGSSNIAGSINTTTTTVNTTAGISVGTYTGTGSNATIGHGLGVVPEMIIVKERSDDVGSWHVYHGANTTAPETDYLLLDTTAATVDAATTWNDTAPTSTVFSIGTNDDVNGSTDTYVYYAFAEIEGFSKFSSYLGNGNTNGTVIYIGFKPSFVMIKKTSGTGSWVMYDSQRSPYNEIDDQLLANTTAAETTGSEEIDFLSNGFKIRTTDSDVNTSSGNYIFAAFAEYPFGGDGATPATAF